jgi:hypothetical protein
VEPEEILSWSSQHPPNTSLIGGQLGDGAELYKELQQKYIKEHQNHFLP